MPSAFQHRFQHQEPPSCFAAKYLFHFFRPPPAPTRAVTLRLHFSPQALRKNPEVGRLLDLGTAVSQEDDSRDLFEKVFQKLDKDSSKTLSRSEFQEYFRPEHANGGVGRDAAASSTAPADPGPTATQTPQPPLGIVNDEWEEIPGGCCGGGGKRLKPRPEPQIVAPTQPQPVVPLAVVTEPPALATAPPAVIPQPQHTAPTSSGADIYPDELEELQEELVFLRSQLKNRGDTLRSKDVRLEEVQKENIQLRSEYNLQSLKQDMLVHMWSMHLLDADLADDE